jgi:ketosteroid isomerase-like protein
MLWLTENPWPLMIILSALGLVALLLGDVRVQRAGWGLLFAAVLVWIIEGRIVTAGEQIEANVQAMLEAFIARDVDAIDEHIAADAAPLKQTARDGLELVELHRTFHLKDVRVQMAPDQQSATVELRANGTLTLRQNNGYAHAPTRWRTTWIRQNDGWKLSAVQRLNPVNGSDMGMLTAQ